MAKMARFILNSDYTAIKEKTSFSSTLSIPAFTVAAFSSANYQKDITVPEGVYIENINLTWSYSGDTVPSPYYIYNDMFTYGQLAIYMAIYKINSTTYRLRFYADNVDENSHNIVASTLSVKGHLFISSL